MRHNKMRDPIVLDPYGSREKETNLLFKPDNLYAKKWLASIAVAVFCFIDFWCIQIVWNTVSRPENVIFVYAVAVGCAVALDVPLSIAGYSLKMRHQRLINRNENIIIMALSISVFIIAFVCSFSFRLATRDLSFGLKNTSTVSLVDAATLGSNLIVPEAANMQGGTPILIAGLFNGVIPLLTSMAAFVISYYGYSPLDEKILRLLRRDIRLDSNIIDLNTAITQAETPEEYYDIMLNREYELYRTHIESVQAEGENLKQAAYLAVIEKLSDSNGISNVTRAAAESVIRAKTNINPKGHFPDNNLEIFDMEFAKLSAEKAHATS